jgi:hypothetical protein
MDQNIIDLIIDELTKHPEISYRRPNANELEIFGSPAQVFLEKPNIRYLQNMILTKDTENNSYALPTEDKT